MDRSTAKEAIKRKIKCTDYLQRSAKGGRGMYCCPFCGSGDGRRGTGAVHYYPETNTFHCFSCGKTGDVFDLFQQDTGADYNTALTQLAADAGITIDTYKPTAAADFAPERQQNTPQKRVEGPRSHESGKNDNLYPNDVKGPRNATEAVKEALQEETIADYSAYYKACREKIADPAAVSYLTARGISVSTAARCYVGFDPVADPAGNPGGQGQSMRPVPRIIIPTTPGHYVGRSIDANTPGQYAKMNNKGGKPGIFNGRALHAQDVQEVFIVEGAFDALSIIEAGAAAAALNSTANADTLLKALEENPTSATLVLCLDNDDAGKRATDVLRQGLTRLNISHITADICGGHKDPNEYLQHDRTGFIDAVQAAQRGAAAKPDNVSDYITQLMGSDIERFKTDIKTGFSNLDSKAGGLYAGLYAVAAISSLGKTTFCSQLADQLAAAGHDVLFFSLEQSRLEMVSKSIARVTAQLDPDTAVTSLAIRKGYGGQAAQIGAKEYVKRVGNRISVVEGNFNCNISFIGDYIRQYIRRNGTRPVCFIDYLQILQPELTNGRQQTTKEMVDSTVTELKRLSREMDLTIFVISSVNRANYLTPIDFESLKESGGIEYTADVVFGLQLQCLNDPLFTEAQKIAEKRKKIKEAKNANPRKIELCCLKNRYGVANFSCYFDYFPANDLFKPNDADFDFTALQDTAPKTTLDRMRERRI